MPQHDLAGFVTLIQTLLSPKRILQVSDRRLTRDGKLVNDSANKVVSWCGKFFIAFTGPAFMDRWERHLPTSEWIAATLAQNGDAGGDVDVTARVELLRESLIKRHETLPNRWDKRMTVTMCGFAKYPDVPGDGLAAVCYTISNYERYEDNEVKIYPGRLPNFEVHVVRCVPDSSDKTRFFYRTNGHQMDTPDLRLIKKLGPRLYDDQNWDGLVRLMIKVQRDISRRADPNKAGQVSRVGLDALVMSLPKLAYDDPLGETLLTDVSTTNLASDRPTFVYLPEAGFSGRAFGPHFVCRGKAGSYEGNELTRLKP